MSSPFPITSISLVLTGSCWHIHAADVQTSYLLAELAKVMSLPPEILSPECSAGKYCRDLQIFTDPGGVEFSSGGYESGPVYCRLPIPENSDMLALAMSYIGLVIARAEVSRGGLLVHGALAQTPDQIEGGILLAGAGSAGKTTASKRLPPPWRSLSDDSSLIVRDDRGQYVAHPWPTWSRFFTAPDGKPGEGGGWDVQCGIPLRAVFFLARAEKDLVTPLPCTPAVAYLMETVQHVSTVLTRNLPADEAQELCTNQLSSAEQLLRFIPSYTLHLSQQGSFWKDIEKALTRDIPPPFSLQPARKASGEIDSKKKTNTIAPSLFGDNILTVSYSGTSMSPTLRHSDVLQVTPYAAQPVNRGDVIYFTPPTGGPRLVHRVIGVAAKGIRTRGDNSSADDPFLLQPADVIGRVTAAWRYDKARKITGGFLGQWAGCRARIRSRLNRFISPMFSGIYYRLASPGFLYHLLPASIQPRIFEFKRGCLPSIFKLLVNEKVIGHYDTWNRCWVIDRPWRLIIDESTLPVASRPASMERSKPHDSIQDKQSL